jgi:ribosome maturation factor RimP
VGKYLDSCEEASTPWFSGKYFVEVSSPGVERPLFTEEHFRRFVGRTARFQMKSKDKFDARIDSCQDGVVVAVLGDGSHSSFNVADIRKANVVFEFGAEKNDKHDVKKGSKRGGTK